MRLNVRYPSGEQRYLRYFDPRVLPRLLPQLAAQNIRNRHISHASATLLGPIQTWCHLDQNGQLLRHENPHPSHRSIVRMRFDALTASAVDRIEAINMTIRVLRQQGYFRDQPNELVIDTELVAAQALGLADNEDLVAYAWRAILYGRTFVSHESLHELASKARVLGIPFDAMVSRQFPFDVREIQIRKHDERL